jgi:hypothetical protein
MQVVGREATTFGQQLARRGEELEHGDEGRHRVEGREEAGDDEAAVVDAAKTTSGSRAASMSADVDSLVQVIVAPRSAAIAAALSETVTGQGDPAARRRRGGDELDVGQERLGVGEDVALVVDRASGAPRRRR